MSETTKSRLAAIEAKLPKPVVLILEDGSTYRHPGPPLKFYGEILKHINENGPLCGIVRRAVRSQGFGAKMLELAKALLELTG